MNNVPNLRFKEFSGGWENKKIGEITIKVGSGKTPKGGNAVYKDKGVIFLRSQNVLNGKLSLNDVAYITEDINSSMKSTEVYPDDILLNITGASIGRSCCIPKTFDKANVNQHVCIIRLDRNHNPNFVMNQIISSKFQKQIDSFQAGGNREGLNFEQIKGMRISSTTIEEQEKIAAFFSLIDKKIELQTEKVEELKNYKKGIMQKIFSQELRFKDENGNDYPEWKIIKLSKVLTERKTYAEKDGKYPHVTLSKDGIYDKGERYDRDFLVKTEDKKYKITHRGDICYNPANLKFGVICRNDFGDAIFSPIYVTFEINKDVDSNYIGYYLTRWDFINKVRKYEEGTVYERMAVKPEDFLKFNINLPNIREQKKISNFLNKIDSKIEFEQKTLEFLTAYKKGLLQQMFI